MPEGESEQYGLTVAVYRLAAMRAAAVDCDLPEYSKGVPSWR